MYVNAFSGSALFQFAAHLNLRFGHGASAELPSEIAAAILPPKVDEKRNGKSKPEEYTPNDLSENERKIWSILPSDEAVHIDVLLESSGLSFGDLNSVLVGLDIRDLIRVRPGKHYARRI